MRFFCTVSLIFIGLLAGACPQTQGDCGADCADANIDDGEAGVADFDAGGADTGSLTDAARPDRTRADARRDSGLRVDAMRPDSNPADRAMADRTSPDLSVAGDAYVAADAAGVDVRGPEICDGLDNDGVGGADDGLTPPEMCNQNGVCVGTIAVCTGAGGWRCFYDRQGYEASELSCDGRDNDCDGHADNGLAPPPICNQQGVCVGTVAACGGAAGWTCTYISADYQADEFRCDQKNNDCDDQTDECAEGQLCHASVSVCTDMLDIDFDGDGLTQRQGDCAPQDAEVKPGLDDLVDGRDNDCDGFVDEFTDDEGAVVNATRVYLPAAQVQPTGEYDYWPVELPIGRHHARLIAYPQASVDLIVGIYDVNGTIVGQGVDANGVGGYEILPFDVTASAPLWIGVSSKTGSTGPYRLAIFPGDYDSGSISGGDGDISMAAVPAGKLVVGATNTDPDMLGNTVTGDELFSLDLSGSLTAISRYHIANMRIRDVDLSPDRTRIAFASNWNAGRDDVYVLDLVAQRTHRISPATLACPDNYMLVGFAHPSFIDESKLVFLGECLSTISAFDPPVDQILLAASDGSTEPSAVTIGGNGCMTPYLVPRAVPGGTEVAVSSGGCTIGISGETLTGGKVTRYLLSNGAVAGDLPAQFGPTHNVHHRLAGWDVNGAGTTYAVCTEEGVIEFSTRDGSYLRGWTYLSNVGRPSSADYWNRETLRYSRDGGRVAYLRHNINDYFDVYVLDLSNGQWSSVLLDMQVRRGAAW